MIRARLRGTRATRSNLLGRRGAVQPVIKPSLCGLVLRRRLHLVVTIAFRVVGVVKQNQASTQFGQERFREGLVMLCRD